MVPVSTPSSKKSWHRGRERVSVLAEMAFRRERFVERLIELREAAGLTQEQAAHLIGVTYRQLQRWEAGESMPYPQNMAKIADAFAVTVAEFFGEEPLRPRLSVTIAQLQGEVDGLNRRLAALELERELRLVAERKQPPGEDTGSETLDLP